VCVDSGEGCGCLVDGRNEIFPTLQWRDLGGGRKELILSRLAISSFAWHDEANSCGSL